MGKASPKFSSKYGHLIIPNHHLATPYYIRASNIGKTCFLQDTGSHFLQLFKHATQFSVTHSDKSAIYPLPHT